MRYPYEQRCKVLISSDQFVLVNHKYALFLKIDFNTAFEVEACSIYTASAKSLICLLLLLIHHQALWLQGTYTISGLDCNSRRTPIRPRKCNFSLDSFRLTATGIPRLQPISAWIFNVRFRILMWPRWLHKPINCFGWLQQQKTNRVRSMSIIALTETACGVLWIAWQDKRAYPFTVAKSVHHIIERIVIKQN